MTGTAVTTRHGLKPGIDDSHASLIRRLYWADGRSLAYVAGLYEVSPSVMQRWMTAHGIPRRITPGTRAGGLASSGHLREYNAQRTRKSAPAQADAVRAALSVLGGRVRPVDAEAGRLRLAYPSDSLAELGVRAGVTKDVMAGRLRRLLLAAREES